MPYEVPLDRARGLFPEFTFLTALTPSEQKAAFHVRDQDGAELCLKLVRPDSELPRLDREIEALVRVDHPNVVDFVGYFLEISKQRVRHYTLERFVAGADLSTRALFEAGDFAATAGLFAQLCDGLGAIHAQDLVHRDLKPSNLRVAHGGTPVIIDFGLVRHLDKPALTRTSFGAQIGTPLYFAPEQWRGTRNEIDGRTDLFALGLMLYETVVGRHPFDHARNAEHLADLACDSDDHLSDQALRRLPRDWQIVLRKLLARSRDRRWGSAQLAGQMVRRLAG